MAEIEAYSIAQPRKFHFDWVLPLILHPRKTMTKVVEADRPVWLTPLVLLTLAAIVLVIVAAPIKAQASQMAPAEMPPDFQYWTPEQQQQYQDVMAAQAGPLFTYALPIAGALVRVWLGWFLLAGILHLVMTLAGGRAGLTTILNVVAWASLPMVLRYLIQIISMLSTHQLIANPGLSGFAPAEPAGLTRFLVATLPYIDLYLFWLIGLIIVGLRVLQGLSVAKTWISVLIAVVILIALQALPGFLGGQFGGLSVTQPFLY